MTGDMSEVVGFLKSGDVRVLAVLTEERIPGFEDIPTAQEQGIDVVAVNWRGLYIPKGVSDATFNLWAERLQKVADSAEWKQAMAANGLAPFTKVGGDFQSYIDGVVKEVRDVEQGTGCHPVMASDRIFGLVAALVALAYIASATQYPDQLSVGPGRTEGFSDFDRCDRRAVRAVHGVAPRPGTGLAGCAHFGWRWVSRCWCWWPMPMR